MANIIEPKDTENNDNIISPNHYTSDKGIEVFDVQLDEPKEDEMHRILECAGNR